MLRDCYARGADDETVKLTDLQLRSMKAPAKRIEIADPEQRGLWIALQPSGRRSFGVRFRRRSDGRNRHYTIDGSPSLATARAIARDVLDRVAQRFDPSGEKQVEKQARKHAPPAAADDVESALLTFMKLHVRTRGGKAIRMTTRHETGRLLGLKHDAGTDEWRAIGRGVLHHRKGRKLAEIKHHDVRSLVEDLAASAPIAANRTLAALKSCFNFHRRRSPDVLLSNPAETVSMLSPARSRDRVLTDMELAACWRAAEAEGYVFGRIVQMLI